MIGPHQNQPLATHGEPLESARAAMIMVHGRGAQATDILDLAGEIRQPCIAYLASQAADRSWYPYPFMTPIEQNEPGISSGLQVLADLMAQIAEHGIAAEKTLLLGFSQGACLALEFAARHAQRYGGVVGLSGGLIGPAGTPRDYPGSLDGTPVFLGCSDVDPHIPKERVTESAEVLEALGAEVTARLYPNLGHTINLDELKFIRKMVGGLNM